MTSRVRRAVANLRAGRGQQILCAATAGSALPLSVEVYVNHYSGSFANKWMWAPVGLLPALGLAGLAGIRSERAAHTVLPATAALTIAAGGFGTVLHGRGIARKPGGFSRGLLQPRHRSAAAGARVAGDGRRDRAAGGDHASRAVVAMAHDFRRADHLPKRRRGRDPAAARAAAAPAPRDDAADARPLPRLRRARQRGSLGRGHSRRRPAARRGGSADPVLRRARAAHAARVLRPRHRAGRGAADPGARDGRREARRRASSTGSATTTCPRTRRPGGSSPRASTRRRAARSPISIPTTRAAWCRGSRPASSRDGVWERLPCRKAWEVVMRGVLSAFYSHPWAWNEIGYGGPAYPRGYMRLGERPARAPPGRRGRRGGSGASGRSGRDSDERRRPGTRPGRPTLRRRAAPAREGIGRVRSRTIRGFCSTRTVAGCRTCRGWRATATRTRSTWS